jgi:hypothetical protein
MAPAGVEQQRMTRGHVKSHVVFPNRQCALANDDQLVVSENPVRVRPSATADEQAAGDDIEPEIGGKEHHYRVTMDVARLKTFRPGADDLDQSSFVPRAAEPPKDSAQRLFGKAQWDTWRFG